MSAPDDSFDAALGDLHEEIVSEHSLGSIGTGQELDPGLSHELERAAECLRLIERVRKRSSSPPIAAPEEQPESIGRLQIKSRLGEGSYGVVYLAHDPDLNLPVAVKVPRAEVVLSPRLRERFLREAEVSAGLRHPHLVRVYQAGREDGIHFLSTEFCNGPSLDEWLRAHGRPLSPSCAAEVVQVLAEAVQHAHGRGVLHRDLKPSNILLHREGDQSGETCAPGELARCVRITDFGLARAMDAEGDATQSGTVIGTPAYMSPEQADGRHADVSSASDTYALGCVLYELLTFAPPFNEPSVLQTLDAVRGREPVSLRSRVDCIPVDLEAICLKCLEKDPARRYESAAQLAADLGRFLNGNSVSARVPGRTEKLVRWSRRNPGLATLWAAVGVLAVAITIGSATAAILLNRAQQTTFDSLQAEIAAKGALKQSEEAAIRALYESRLSYAEAARNSGLPGQRFNSLKAIAEAGQYTRRLGLGPAEELRRRNEAIGALSLVDLRIDRKWPGLLSLSVDAPIGFDSRVTRYARSEPGGVVAVRSVLDNTRLAELPGYKESQARRVLSRFSPDDRFLVVSGQLQDDRQRIRVFDLQADARMVVDEPVVQHGAGINFAVTADSGAVVAATGRYEVSVIPIRDPSRITRIPVSDTVAWMAAAPDGSRAAVSFVDSPMDVSFVDLESGRVSPQRITAPAVIHCGAWSPDGDLLAIGCEDCNVYLHDGLTGDLASVCQGHQRRLVHVAFGHESHVLVSSAQDLSIGIWEPRTGQRLLSANGIGTEFSADDRWLGMGFAGVALGRWEVATSRVFYTMPGFETPSAGADLDYSPDSRLLAAAGMDDGVHVWDARDLRRIASVPGPGNSVEFSADGRSLLFGGRGNPVRELPLKRSEGAVLPGEPVTRFETSYSKSRFSLSKSQDRAVVNLDWDTAVLIELESGEKLRTLKSPDFRYHSLSPDGRLLAKGNWRDSGAKVWDTQTGELVRELDIPGSVRVLFSPDGDVLVTTSVSGYALWRTSDWSPLVERREDDYSRRRAGFSGDGRLLAVGLQNGVGLIDPRTGRELARLTPPRQFGVVGIALNSDASQLAAGTMEGPICFWEISALREELAKLGLDWDQTQSGN